VVPGNAKIQGMTKDLNMKGDDYNIALFIFFVPYILFEIPSNLIIKKVAPSTWLSAIMFLWGVTTIGQGLIKTNGGLQAMRFLLGFFEAGFVPGCEYYQSEDRLLWALLMGSRYVLDLNVLQTVRAAAPLQHLVHGLHLGGSFQRSAGVWNRAYGWNRRVWWMEMVRPPIPT
jgi:hypothetical protein